jgi:microcin C transport system substrate-binding protein
MRVRGAGVSRRDALKLAGAGAALLAAPFAWAAGRGGLHGLSVFGELKYAPDFKHFDYVEPSAPKGGRMNFQPPDKRYNQNSETFNTLNAFVRRGDSPPRMEMTFDALMAPADDEPDSIYGLVAESAAVSEDGNVFTFTLRPEARFHDGSPLTADDVAFSLMLLKDQGHPNISQVIAPMTAAEALDGRTVAVTLSGKQNRSTILTIATLPIFSKAYYSARQFDESTLDPPLGSGPYKVGALSAGKYIEYQRVADYWGRDLPVRMGTGNFDLIRVNFYRDRQTAFEAFKKGEVTFREEFTSKTWNTEYDFPSLAEGKVVKEELPGESRPDIQGWFFNTRRAKLADPRVRLAIGLAFDFEWTNRNLFYGAYKRGASFFGRSDFTAEGLPGPDELALLEPFRTDLPPEAFGPPYVPPVSDGSGRDRAILRQAKDLLSAAGWKAGDTVEFLADDPTFERILGPYGENLRRIGVTLSVRTADAATYEARVRDFDYDVTMARHLLSATPLDGLQQFFSSLAADTPGSYNYAGIKEKAVDAALARLPSVQSRAELIAVTKVIDRVLRARHYWVPNWYSDKHRLGHWDLFGRPQSAPKYEFRPEETWWFDPARATAIGMAG